MRPPLKLATKIALFLQLVLVCWAIYAWNVFITPITPEAGIGIFILSVAAAIIIILFWITIAALSATFDGLSKIHVAAILLCYTAYFILLISRPGLIGIIFFAAPALIVTFFVTFVARSSRASRQTMMHEWRSARASSEASAARDADPTAGGPR